MDEIIFNGKPLSMSGAEFSDCRKYRFALWRVWDKKKPLVMFIGLNPSTANENDNDPTIRSVCRISKFNGYGGVFMMNCFPYISTDPNISFFESKEPENKKWLKDVRGICQDVVFAWGNFEIVRRLGVDFLLWTLFPDAKAISLNKNGSPKHPLYCKSKSQFVTFTLKPKL